MDELLRIFPGSAVLNKKNETPDDKPAPQIFLGKSDDIPYGWMVTYSTLLEVLRQYHPNKKIYAHKPWQTYLAVTNLVEHLLQNKERIAMFIDDIASEILLLTSEDIGSYMPKEMDIILNGQPTQKQFEKLMELQEKEDISIKMIPEYDSELTTLMFGGESYMFWDKHERFKGKISPTQPECASLINFKDDETLRSIAKYWSSEIKSKAVELSPAESLAYSK